jgi:DNA-directed RNA polymerase specialized sigma24 family protein
LSSKINFARATLSSAGDHVHGDRSIRSKVFSLIPLLRAMARVRTRNQTAADDLVEVTLRLAVARRNQLPDGGNLMAWLLAIQRAILASDSYNQSSPVSELSRKSGANWRTLHRALLQLPETLREALFLSAGAGYDHEKIAEIVGIEVGTAKCRAEDAMRRLVELLDVHNNSGGPTHAHLPLRNASTSNAELLHPNRLGTLARLFTYANQVNIRRYKRLLNETTDGKRQKILQGLLSEEEAKMSSNGWKPNS